MVNSRTKGASYEREVAIALELELGIQFNRNLSQTQSAGQNDLTPTDAAFPFSIECKRPKSNQGAAYFAAACKQSKISAQLNNLLPAVLYRFNNHKTRALVPFAAIVFSEVGKPSQNLDDFCDITLDQFCTVCREIMAWKVK